jgi:hypothetical protein
MPASYQSFVVEFIGGPYDGHKQVVECGTGQPDSTVVMPALYRVLAANHGEERSVLYSLESSPCGWHYRHAGWATAPKTGWRWQGLTGCFEWLIARIARYRPELARRQCRGKWQSHASRCPKR